MIKLTHKVIITSIPSVVSDFKLSEVAVGR